MTKDEKFAADLVRQAAFKAVEQWDGQLDEELALLLDEETGSSFWSDYKRLKIENARFKEVLRFCEKALDEGISVTFSHSDEFQNMNDALRKVRNLLEEPQ